MPKYLFIYHGGKTPETQEEGEAAMAAWGAWFEELGAATLDGGNPVGQSHTVSATGHTEDGGPNPVSGYGIFQFDDYAAACAAAAKNPMVLDGSGASVEVAQIHEM
ncbi:MAG: YciI family protein [Pseudomonadota bacterium]